MSAAAPWPAPRDLRGRPLRDLRLSVIDACNFRCPYCMPADRFGDGHGTRSADRLTFDEIEVLVRASVRLGVRKLRLTGGEPLLRKRLPVLVSRLRCIEGLEDIALTTNGALLAPLAAPLKRAGLSRVTVSLDALDADRFRLLSGGRGHVRDVLAGIAAAGAAGFPPIKINCVIQRGVNEDQVDGLIEYARRGGHVLRFIEYMDVGSCNGWRPGMVVPAEELRQRIERRWPLRLLPPNHPGEVARRYGFVDGTGETGFISSVSAPFCGDCLRARVSARGEFYGCLFAAEGVPLRPWLERGEEVVADRLAELWRRRDDHYSELRATAGQARPGRKVEMFLVGG